MICSIYDYKLLHNLNKCCLNICFVDYILNVSTIHKVATIIFKYIDGRRNCEYK